jgi:hypothetical protein
MDLIKRTQATDTLTVPIGHERVREVAVILAHIRQLTPFTVADTELENWARSILALSPNFDLNKLAFIINQFKLGNIEWQRDVGIQNIIMNLRRVRDYDDGFRLINSTNY